MSFHRQVYKVVVLTEDDTEVALEDLNYCISEGDDCLQSFTMESTEELTGKQMADALYDAGSDPSFFLLDNDGNPLDE